MVETVQTDDPSSQLLCTVTFRVTYDRDEYVVVQDKNVGCRDCGRSDTQECTVRRLRWRELRRGTQTRAMVTTRDLLAWLIDGSFYRRIVPRPGVPCLLHST